MQASSPMATYQGNRSTHCSWISAYFVSIYFKMLCDAGWTVIYDNTLCKVLYRNTIVWQGQHQPSIWLWIPPLVGNQATNQQQPAAQPIHQAKNALAVTYKQALIKYLHQYLFLAPKITLIKACEKTPFFYMSSPHCTCGPNVPTWIFTGYRQMSHERHKQGIRSTEEKLERR